MRSTIGFVVRTGSEKQKGMYLSVRLRVVLGQPPKAEQLTVMLSRYRQFATVFPVEERGHAEALARKYKGRVVRLVTSDVEWWRKQAR